MLAQFSVENFMSIKGRMCLNMSASLTDNEHPGNYTDCGKTRCLKSVVVYGANASGKSNLLKAMTAAIMIVRESQTKQVDDRLFRIVPFLFDKDLPGKPSAFEFIFFVDGIQYIYGFSATQEKIVDEYLYVYHSAKRSMIFERTNTNQYKFNKADEKEFNSYKEKNTANKLFLSTATAWNCEKTKAAFMWFSNGIDTYTDAVTDDIPNNKPLILQHFVDSQNPELKEFTLKLLKNADINIDGYDIRTQQITVPISVAIAGDKVGFGQGTVYNVITSHNMPDNQRFDLDFSLESLGTQNIFFLSPFIYAALSTGKTLFIDEMSCLHSALVQYLVGLFNDPDINKTNAQLIFVTHDTILLDLRVFRRDQIYFIEKDENGASNLYSLDNFSVRKTENIRTAYLMGRYGAIPIIKNGDLL